MRILIQDLRYAVRVFRAHPGVTLIAVLSLALAIGANSTMFGIVDGIYLRPLPVHDPAGLVWIDLRTPEGRHSSLNWLDYLTIKESAPAFADIAVQNRRGTLIERDGETEAVLLTIVSDNYFPLLGVQAARGRLFRADLDVAMQNEPAIVISDSLWRRRFGADPGLVGRSIRMMNRSFTVVGILPPEFRSLDRGVRTDVWVPVSTWKAMGAGSEFTERGTGPFEPVGRLASGATLPQAVAQLEAVRGRFEQARPETYRGRRLVATAEPERESKDMRDLTVLLLAIVGLVVLIACANVAVLLLAQAEARKKEIAIRMAMGVPRRRLVRQLVTESALLAAIGGAFAVVIARWLIPLVPALMPPGPDYVSFDVRMDARVLAVTIGVCLAAVLMFGAAPAVGALRTDLNAVIKGGGSARRCSYAGRGVLVAVQAALGVVLLAAAGLLARSFMHTAQSRMGFDTDRNIAIIEPIFNLRSAARIAAADQLLDRLRALPGVKNAAYCYRLPFSDYGGGATVNLGAPGSTAGGEVRRLRFNTVSPDYFAVTGTRVLAGRAFTAADASGLKVALVNETMARQYWPGRSPVGEWLKLGAGWGSAGGDVQIVGVAENGAVTGLHENPEAFVYFPFAQGPDLGDMSMLVETAGDPATMLPVIKREFRAAQPGGRIFETGTLRQQVHDALYRDWAPAVLSAVISALGMALAAAGLFGVVLHSVNRRLREMGIRVALGARVVSIVGLVLRHGLMLACAGALAGVTGALACGRYIAHVLHGVSPYDPTVLAASVIVTVVVALAASVYPAWKATRVDAVTVLRAE